MRDAKIMSKALENLLVFLLNLARFSRIREFFDSTRDVSDLLITCRFANR
jgi:hypothetical protein